jgi:hypothetical protein
MPQPSSAGLVLNVAPIEYHGGFLKAYSVSIASPEQFATIREQYRGTHLVRRYGDSEALVIPLRPDSAVVGAEVEVDLGTDPWLAAALVRNALTDYLFRIGRVILKSFPLSFVDSKTDLVEVALQNKKNQGFVSVRPVIDIDVRVFEFESQVPFVGAATSVRIVKTIEGTCTGLLNRGLDTTGLYVGRKLPDRDARIASRFVTIGQVERVEGKDLILQDYRPGNESISADDAYVDASPATVIRVLEHLYGSDALAIRTKMFHAENDLHSGPKKLEKLRQVNSFFQTLSLELAPGINFSIKPFVSKLPPIEVCQKPTYVFDPSGRQKKNWHDGGLTEFGPYTRVTFSPSRPRICIICQRQRRGRVEQFIQKFLRGIPSAGDKRAAFPNGLLGKYRLENCTTTFLETDNESADAYKRAALQAIQKSTNEGFRWDLALVQVAESFKPLQGDLSPYFVTKSIFLTHQIPVQDFRAETTSVPDQRLQYVLNNMALATYAKMGGIPWLLEANPTVAHELVIGIGSAHLRHGRFGGIRRLVGITTVFSGDGKYRLSTLSKAVEIDRYGEALLESLRDTVTRVRTEMNWQPKDHVRLVFHAFKPVKNIEAEAVKTAMQELGDFDLDYAFLHVAAEHPLVLFDTAQQGAYDYETKRAKGVFAPSRGLFMHLSGRDTLLALVGPNEVKTSTQGIPSPLVLHLHPSSTFSDMTYLARQVFLFASHSWRSFFPSELPVTIKYSDLIARLLGNLEMLSNWNPEAMVGRIANARWFL